MVKESEKDQELLRACFEGNQRAWERFVRSYSKLVYFSIHQAFKISGFVPGREEVEDIFGGIFLSFFERDFKKLRSFQGRGGCSLASWIRLIASRHTLDYLRNQGRHASIVVKEEFDLASAVAPDDLPSDIVARKERELLARNALKKLKAEEVLFLRLYYDQERSPEEIADILGISVSTVYSRKNRIKEKLKKFLKGFS